MTIPLTTSGGIFTRLGHIIGGINDVNAIRGGPATARVLTAARWPVDRANQLETDFAASPANQAILDGLYIQTLNSWQTVHSGLLSQLSQLASALLIKMADQDSALSSKDVPTALALLISQMKTAVASVNQSVVAAGAQTAVGTPNGNPIILVSTKAGNGTILENIFPETLTFVCSADSQGGGTLNQEPMTIKGPAPVSDPLNWLWPAGSGVNTSLSCTDATLNNSGGNLLTNSDFETFTVANTPDNWPILVGTPGTTIFMGSTGNSYDQLASLQITGTGAELTSLVQPFNTTPGSVSKLTPDTVYGVNLYLKVSAVPAAGVLEVSLVDGSNAVINDDLAVANLFTKSLPAATTGYLPLNGVFRTPAVLPAVQKLRVRLSTALDNTKSVFVDHLAMNKMTQIYTGGPFISIFSANTKLIVGDTWTVAITNTPGLFQQAFEKLFGMRNLGLQLPSNVAPTIADSLIV